MKPFLSRSACSYEYVPTLGTHPNSTSTFKHAQKTWDAYLFRTAKTWAYGLILNRIKHKSMLGWDLGIISSQPQHQFIASFHSIQAQRLRMCTSHRLKQKLRSRILNNSANGFSECVFGIACVFTWSTDFDYPCEKNRNLLQISPFWTKE